MNTWKNNIEGIIIKLKEEAKLTIKFKKFNGITFECRVPIDCDRESAIKEMEELLSRYQLFPYQIGRDTEVQNAYTVQFPELDVIYSNEEKIKMYKQLFKFFLDNLNENKKELVSKSVILDFKYLFVKQTIQAFWRSNLNQYKISEKELLNDEDYRNTLFIEYVDEYLKDKILAE